MEAWMLTPEERAKAVNDDFYHSHEAVAQAQADKMIRAGFKSPEQVQNLKDLANDILRSNKESMKADAELAISQARQEALREVGAYCQHEIDHLEYMNREVLLGVEAEQYRKIGEAEITTLRRVQAKLTWLLPRSGRMPEGTT